MNSLRLNKKIKTPLKVKGLNANDVRKFQAKAKDDAEKTAIVFCDPDALNLTAQYIAPMKETESKNRKCIFLLGEMATVPITEKCKDYVYRDPSNPKVLCIVPKYGRNTPRVWPKINEKHPLSDEDTIYLKSYGYYAIKVPPSLPKSVSPGDFVTLTDVSFEVFIPRALPTGSKISELSEAQLEWTDEDVEKAGAVFFFRAKSFTSLSKKGPVSQRSLLKLYDDRGLITRWITGYDVENMGPKAAQNDVSSASGSMRIPNHTGSTEEERNTALDKANSKSEKIPEEEASVIFHNKYAYLYEPMRMDLVPFDGSSSVEDDMVLYPSSDGNSMQGSLSWLVSDRFISEKDKEDKVKYEAIKSREEMDVMLKAWTFTFSVLQRIYGPPSPSKLIKEGKTLEDYEETGGFNLETPTHEELVSAKVSLYNDVIEREFGIINKDTWTHFAKIYGSFFSGILQCSVDAKRTLQRMERLNTIVAEHSFAGGRDASGGSIADRTYDTAIQYRCGRILFDMREWVQKIGIPISNEMVLELLPLMEAERNIPSTNDIKEIPTYNTHAVACLNEIRSVATCAEYVRSNGIQVYAIVMPGRLNPTRMKMIEEITDTCVGDQVMNIVTLKKQSYTEGLHDPSIESLQKFLFEEMDDSQFPLLFAVCDINSDFYNNEITTLSKFLGINDTIALKDWLYFDYPTEEGEEMDEEERSPEDEEEEKEEEEEMMASQALPGSMDELDYGSIDPPPSHSHPQEEKPEEASGDSRGTKRTAGGSSKSVTFESGTKTTSTGGRRHSSRRSGDRSRHSSRRR